MGVMACDRNGCDNIMCDVCIEGRWYVCGDCQLEFRTMIGDESHPRAELLTKFEQFMESKKRCERGLDMATVDEFFGT